MLVATLRCSRAFLMVSTASLSSRIARESGLPQMSVVTAPSSAILAQLLEHGAAEHRVVQRGGTQTDQTGPGGRP